MSKGIALFVLVVFAFWVVSVIVHRSRVVKAKLLSINEISEQVLMQYSTLEYFHPIATYQYEFKGQRYNGEITEFNRFKYRECALAYDGTKRPDNDFPWRSAKVGMEFDVNIRAINPKYSYIGKWYNSRAKRELKILTSLVWLGFPITAWVYVYNF